MNTESSKFGREEFEKVQASVETAESNLKETKTITAELRKELKEAATNEDVTPETIISLAQRLQENKTDAVSKETILSNKTEKYKTFYNNMHGYALEENELRDEFKEAVKAEDYEKVIEVAERLKQHDNPKNPESYNAQGTQELYEKFASKFKYIGGLVEGKALVKLPNDKWAFIDQEGKVVSDEYNNAESYSEGKARVKLPNDKYAFIDHEGKVVSREYSHAYSYSEGKARVELPSGKWAFIDHEGKVVSDEYNNAYSYSEGKAWVLLPSGKWAFIDHEGKVVSREYSEAESYSEGKAGVELPSGKWAFIDHEGKVIPFVEM